MTLEEIITAVDAGDTVHWANEGYIVHKDGLGQYLITFTANGSTVGLTDRTSTKLNGDSALFFVTRPDLGITMRCETCQSEEVQHKCWAAWNPELQMWEVDQFDDTIFCNRCHMETYLITKPIREYGRGAAGQGGETAHNVDGQGIGQSRKGESQLSFGGPRKGLEENTGCTGTTSGTAQTQGEDQCSQEP